jgi:hypothetical protein
MAVAITASASADQPTITGTVEDTSGNPLTGVTVNVQDPSTDATVTSTTTASDGTFSASVDSGTYNAEFIAPSSTGLQSYLATGVAAGSAALTIILKSAVVIQVQGTLSDAQGNVYTSAENAEVMFSSPLNSGDTAKANGSGGYSLPLLADQNFTADVYLSTPGDASQMDFYGLPVGTLDASQTYDMVVPTAGPIPAIDRSSVGAEYESLLIHRHWLCEPPIATSSGSRCAYAVPHSGQEAVVRVDQFPLDRACSWDERPSGGLSRNGCVSRTTCPPSAVSTGTVVRSSARSGRHRAQIDLIRCPWPARAPNGGYFAC